MTAMIEVKVAELSGEALAWAVWLADRGEPGVHNPKTGYIWTALEDHWAPHCDWSQGGPLLDKYRAYPSRYEDECPDATDSTRFFVLTHGMVPSLGDFSHVIEGASALIAAMRAIVAAKLGPTVSVPAELVGGV